MNQNDLRVIKTKENIFNAFIALLEKKPLYKISVQELCKNARINKGTFYYHYEDIYDLYKECVEKEIGTLYDFIDCYDKVLTNPALFLYKLKEHRDAYHTSIDVVLQEKTMSNYKDIIIEGFVSRTYQALSLEKNDYNDARLYTLFNTILELSPRYGEKDYVSEKILNELSIGLFPNP